MGSCAPQPTPFDEYEDNYQRIVNAGATDRASRLRFSTNPFQHRQLPAGWSFRAVTLEQDRILTPENGTARILQDDVGNTYDRVGGPFSNYKP